MALRAVNQNLLPILLALLRDRNVTRAAQSLGLSQPAVSKALIQLRAILNDELLVRAGQGLALTKRGEELLVPVIDACAALERIWRPQTFDPAVSRREFVIAGTDYTAMLMVPALAGYLAAQAPGISMRFVDLMPQLLLDDRTDIDFAMIPNSFVPRRAIHGGGMIKLFVDDYVAVVAKNHPLASAGALATNDLTKTPSIVFGNDNPLFPKEIKSMFPFEIAGSHTLAVVQQFLMLPLLAILTGTMTVIPRRMVELVAPIMPLHILDGVVPMRQVEVSLIWHARRDRDADHRWFRNLVAAHFSDDEFC